MNVACRLCGRFQDGHYVPPKLRPPLLEQQTSPSWHKIYQNWQRRQSIENNRIVDKGECPAAIKIIEN
jgi:hypothetical protein